MGMKITHSGSLGLSHSITLSDDILEHAVYKTKLISSKPANKKVNPGELKSMMNNVLDKRKKYLRSVATSMFDSAFQVQLNAYHKAFEDAINTAVSKNDGEYLEYIYKLLEGGTFDSDVGFKSNNIYSFDMDTSKFSYNNYLRNKQTR